MKFFSPLVLLTPVLALCWVASASNHGVAVAALKKELVTVEAHLDAFGSSIKSVYAKPTECQLDDIHDDLAALINSLEAASTHAAPLQFPHAQGQSSVLLAPLLKISTKIEAVLVDLVVKRPAFARVHGGISEIKQDILIFQSHVQPFVDSVGRTFDEVTGRGTIYHLESHLKDVFQKAIKIFAS